MSISRIVEFDTAIGYKSVELHNGSITELSTPFDILVVSSYEGDYLPTETSLIGAIYHDLGVDIGRLAKSPAIDFRDSMGIWLSSEIYGQSFSRILCIEGLLSFEPIDSLKETFMNLFAFLSLLPYHEVAAESITMPLVGSGDQGIDAGDIIPIMMYYARKAIENNTELKRIQLVEKDKEKSILLSKGLDQYLQNNRFNLTILDTQHLGDVLIKRLVSNLRLLKKQSPEYAQDETVDTLVLRLEKNDLRLYEFGILSRRFLEITTTQLLKGRPLNKKLSLYKRIEALKQQNVAKWIIQYFHSIRNLGNAAAHTSTSSTSSPPSIGSNDIQAIIVILNCICKFLNERKDG